LTGASSYIPLAPGDDVEVAVESVTEAGADAQLSGLRETGPDLRMQMENRPGASFKITDR
jgi:hypothetical protein